jgi:hypothetical protein
MRVGERIPMTRHNLAVPQAVMSLLIHAYVLHICCPAIRQMGPACARAPSVRAFEPTNKHQQTSTSIRQTLNPKPTNKHQHTTRS